MAPLVLRASTTITPITKSCHILALPAELRLLIYNHLVPGGFLPNAHHRRYIGLLLSCSQIYHELTTETIRLAPFVLHGIQYTANAAPMKLQPLRPTNFASLMHVTVGIQRWAIDSRSITNRIFSAMIPLLELHLASLTIGIEELECEYDVWQMFSIRSPHAWQTLMNQAERIPGGLMFLPREPTIGDGYFQKTVYSDIMRLATSINCLVAPGLCNGKHRPGNAMCLRRSSPSQRPKLPANECNVRKIILCLKNLNDEDHSLDGGRLRRLVYPHGIKSTRRRGTTTSVRWCPTREWRALLREGWEAEWEDEMGITRRCSRRKPAMFVWKKSREKFAEKRPNRVKKALKSLFKRA